MKNYLLCNRLNIVKFSPLALLFLVSCFVNAQRNYFIKNPPKSLQQKFDSLYPKVADVLWLQYDSGAEYTHEAIFTRDSNGIGINFTRDGKIDSSIQLNRKNVPLQLKLKFKAIFPEAPDKFWDKGFGGTLNKANYNYCTASFDEAPSEPRTGSIIFDSLGNVVKIKYTLLSDSIPLRVKKYIRRKYKGYSFNTPLQVIVDKNNIKTYLVLVRNDNVRANNKFSGYWFYFDKNWKSLKTKPVTFVPHKIDEL